ncbi:MAG: hypothetical protein ACK5L3_00265 [Oscillospiraceae bacterium]
MAESNFHFQRDDFEEIIKSLRLFLSEKEIDDVRPSVKFRNDILANSTLQKILNREKYLDAENIRIIVASLQLQSIKLTEALRKSKSRTLHVRLIHVNFLLESLLADLEEHGLHL